MASVSGNASYVSDLSPLRIAVVAHLKYPIAEPFSGGLEMHTHLLVSKLAERGHHVTLFAAAGSDGAGLIPMCQPTGALDDDPASKTAVDGIEADAYRDIVAHLETGGFDLIHFNALHYGPLEQAAALPAPMVVALHTPPFDPLEAAVSAAAAADVTCMAVSKSLAADWPALVAKPLVIDNGIDLTRFPFLRPAADDVYAVWSGRIVPEKGLHLAIQAAELAGIPLKIAGPISDLPYWHTEIAPRLGSGATYLGHLPQSDLATLVGHASVALCTPRWEEPFGLVVVEALACGTPVAAFARGALPDILDAASGALAEADDVVGLADAVRACLTLDRRDCRNRAEADYDAEVMIDRYEALYHSVIRARATTVGDSRLVGEDA